MLSLESCTIARRFPLLVQYQATTHRPNHQQVNGSRSLHHQLICRPLLWTPSSMSAQQGMGRCCQHFWAPVRMGSFSAGVGTSKQRQRHQKLLGKAQFRVAWGGWNGSEATRCPCLGCRLYVVGLFGGCLHIESPSMHFHFPIACIFHALNTACSAVNILGRIEWHRTQLKQ